MYVQPSTLAIEPVREDIPGSPERVRVLIGFVKVVLLVVLLDWQLNLLGVLFTSTPRNDFGRPFWGTLAFLQGQDMYALNESVIWYFNKNTVLNLWDLNPPHAHLLYLPLTLLSPSLALLVWCVSSGTCLWASIRIILRQIDLKLSREQIEWTVLGLLAFTGMSTAVITGHVSFLLMLVITLAWRDARAGRWSRAGAWLGLGMSVKPFLLIFVPYLALKGRWRALAAVGLAVGAAFMVGLMVFGPANHRSWLRVLAQAESWAWLPMNASLFGYMSRALKKNPGFSSIIELQPGLLQTIWLVLAIPAGLFSLWRACADSTSQSRDRAFGILLVSALILSPLGWTYYFWLPVGPIAALARGWWIQRSMPAGDGDSASSRLSWYLLLASVSCLIFPAWLFSIPKPGVLATLLLGGLTFVGLLLVWLSLVLDGLDLPKNAARARAFALSVRNGGDVSPSDFP
jgi:hypothetical protein